MFTYLATRFGSTAVKLAEDSLIKGLKEQKETVASYFSNSPNEIDFIRPI